MSSIVIKGNTSGQIELAAPDVAGSTTLTMPTTDGTVITNNSAVGDLPKGPAFIAYNSGGTQTISNATWTKIEFDTTQYDTNSDFDTTNDKFLPTVAGYYQIAAHISSQQFGGNSNNTLLSLWKNNADSYRLDGGYQASGSYMYSGGSTLVYLNGSTDYVELYLYQTSGSNVTIQNGGTHVRRLSGVLVRGA